MILDTFILDDLDDELTQEQIDNYNGKSYNNQVSTLW